MLNIDAMTKAPKPYAAQAHDWKVAKFRELCLWLVFVVLAGAFPIWVVYNNKRMTGQEHISLAELVLDGEMLLLAFGIAADSLSRLLSRFSGPQRSRAAFGTYQLIVFLASLVFLVASASGYSSLVANHLHVTATGEHVAINVAYLLSQSEWLSIAALGTGAGVVLVD